MTDYRPPRWLAWIERVPDRLRIYFEWRDIWIGGFISDKGIVYVCLVPCLVIAWKWKAARNG